MNDIDLGALLDFAHGLADTARGIARQHFRRPDAVETKDDLTPVTAADRAIERALRAAIGARLPDHGVLGEEEGPDRAGAAHLWVIDPIDGTKAFASGNPLFGTLIGLCRDGVPVLGVLDAPALGERWAAAHGRGATHDGRPIHTRAGRSLDEAVVYCTVPDHTTGAAGFARLRDRARWTCYGGDCLAYAFVAMGGADLVVDRDLAPYDWCALAPILQEAGGVLVGWDLQPLPLTGRVAVIAAGSAALAAAAATTLTGQT